MFRLPKLACRFFNSKNNKKGGGNMAIFHSHVQVIKRSKGKSAVAAAAYRAGETIKNEYDGITHDFTRKRGVVLAEIILPDHAPRKYADRAVLWNAVEKIEKADNSQLARELEISLPIEFTREQNIALARTYATNTFVSVGMCADLCIHDVDGTNPHMHIMLTMRPFNENGTWGSKQKKEYTLDRDGNKIYDPVKRQYQCRSIPSTDWNRHAKADEWRKAWEDMANAELERLGFDVRIDRRSYAEQGIELIPTIHMGVAASQMEKKGIRTERGDINREIEITNKEIRQLRARMNKLSDWLKEEAANPKPPTLYDVFVEILNRPGRSKITNLQNAAEILAFLQRNDIADDADMDKKVNAMHSKLNSVSKELNKTGRRIETLNEHLYQSAFYNEHRALKRQYNRIYAKYEATKQETGLFKERKVKKALEAVNDFYEANRTGLTLFDAAEKHLREHMQKHYNPKKPLPISDWKKELKEKLADKTTLTHEYNTLKDETYKMEQIRASVKTILHNEMPQAERTVKKSWGVEI